MRKFSKILSLFLVLLILTTMTLLPVQAATNNSCLNVSGSAANCNKWYTITLETGKNWLSNKITFSQTNGTMHYGANLFDEKTYGAYTIKVTDQSTGKTSEYYWKYKETYTIKLKDNTKYTIKIKPYQPATVGDQNLSKSKSVAIDKAWRVYNKSYWSWNKAPTWRVKSTKAVKWCYSTN